MAAKTTQMSLKYLRALGHEAQVVEYWNEFAKRRIDLFNWLDIVSVCDQIWGIQTTTYANMGSRLQKAKGNQALKNWLNSGGRLIIHGWKKVKNRWCLETRDLTLDDL